MAHKGTVKWFNKNKGFGFITPERGQEDVFVHISAVERSGLQTLIQDQKVTFDQQNHHGRTQAVNLTVVAEAPSNMIESGLTGTVKWFNKTKGFGFIEPSTGDNDVFVHITAVEASGFEKLYDGQPVAYDLIMGKNGLPKACNIKVRVDAMAAE